MIFQIPSKPCPMADQNHKNNKILLRSKSIKRKLGRKLIKTKKIHKYLINKKMMIINL